MKKQFSTLNSQFSTTKGFTLIELLVVIAIISILSTLLVANFISARQKTRDSERKAELRQIQAALEAYRNDQGYYPVTAEVTCGAQLKYGSGTCPGATCVEYIHSIPCDPINSGDFTYKYDAKPNGAGLATQYVLRACLENISDSQKDAGNGQTTAGPSPFTAAGCTGPSGASGVQADISYSLYSP